MDTPQRGVGGYLCVCVWECRRVIAAAARANVLLLLFYANDNALTHSLSCLDKNETVCTCETKRKFIMQV